MGEQTWRMPLLYRWEQGEALTHRERLMLPFLRTRAALRRAIRKVRDTAQLRERCVNYAVQAGAKGYNVTDEADRIKRFIIAGER